MAERIIHQLVDDLDQTEIADGKGSSVEFALRGTTYRIDLHQKNVAKLDKALAPFIDAATTISKPRGTTKKSAGAPSRSGTAKRKRAVREATTATVRAWAAENGHDVSARGRIPASVSQAYESAHATAT